MGMDIPQHIPLDLVPNIGPRQTNNKWTLDGLDDMRTKCVCFQHGNYIDLSKIFRAL